MPEIPDIEAYLEALRARILGERLLGVRLLNPFFLRSVDPPLAAVCGARVEGLERLGKRVVIELSRTREARARNGSGNTDEVGAGSEPSVASYFLVLHLMIAGRLHWKEAGAKVARGSSLAAFDFVNGALVVTEAGKKRRASLRLVRGRDALAGLAQGGLEVMGATREEFRAALRSENHTLKRALTDPRILSGIGNAYSDEILHRSGLSPLKQTRSLDDAELDVLQKAAVSVLSEWTDRLRAEAREGFPEKVTAFRPDMAVHGRFGSPCPVCGTKVERIVYAENECDYCPRCQTGGRVLADRSLSRLLKGDWPRTVEELERARKTDESAGEEG
jgi:formamidopyrimidine-DNA glycosylase